jgi:hypothetical protein
MPASRPRPKHSLPIQFRIGVEGRSASLRRKLGLSPIDHLDTDDLAAHLEVPLCPLSSLAGDCPEAVFSLITHKGGRAAFSAAAVADGELRPLGIVYNDAHERVRQRADIAHECAHLLLGHEPSAKFDEEGMRVYPEKEEAEAHWFGPAILVPRAGLLEVLRDQPTLVAAADHFEVSIELVRYRYNTTGCKPLVALAS